MTLDEYTAAARPLNPDYTDAQIAEQYHTEFPSTPQEAKAMPTLEEYTAAAKPLNPEYSDQDIAAQWQSEFGSAGARKEKPGFLESFTSGAKQGAYELGVSGAGTVDRLQNTGDPLKSMADELGDKLAKTAEEYHPSRDLSQEPWYTRLRDPEYLGNLLGNVAVQSTPALAGAAAGGLLGGPAGAMAGMTAVTYFQQAGSTYREALERHKKDGLSEEESHEKAYTESGIAGLVSGAVNALAVPASLAAPFTGVLKNLATKYALNIGVDTADQVTQNLVEQKTFKPEQELTAGVPEALVASAVLGAPENMAAINAFAKPKAEEKADIYLDQTAGVLQAPDVETAIAKAQQATDVSPISTEQLDAFIAGEQSKLDIDVGRSILDGQSAQIEQERLEDQTELVDALKALSPDVMGETSLTTDEAGNTFFNGSPVDVVHPTALPDTAGPEDGMSKEKYEVFSDIASLFGKRVVVYKDSESMPEGLARSGESTVFVADKTRSADLFSVFSHEALHLMEGTEFHSALGMAVWENMAPEAKQLAIDRHGELSHDELLSEITADIAGTELHKPEIWEKVYRNLNEKVGEEKAKTEMISFIDQIKGLIEKVKQLITSKPWSTGFGASKKTYAEQYVKDLTKIHDALASGVANAIYETKTGIPGQGKLALAKRSSKVSRTIVHPDTVKAFGDLAKAQRGKPESAMLEVQSAAGGGVLSPVVEDVGDLIHRMTEQSANGMTQSGIVMTKISRSLGLLGSKYGFEKEHDENLRNNSRAEKKPVAERRTAVDAALAKYADEHRKLPVYNEAQHLAREASVAVGEKRFKDAVQHLKSLKKLVSSPDADKSVFSYAKDGYVPPPKDAASKEKKKIVENKSENVVNESEIVSNSLQSDKAEQPITGKTEQPKKEDYDYAGTQINLPGPLAKRVLEIGKQIEAGDLAEKGLETVPHITVKYGLHAEDPTAVASLVASSKGVSAKIGDVGMFATDEADVIILKVVSPDLVELNKKISTLPNTTEFEYTPHITIAYVKKGVGKGYVRTIENPLEGQSVSVNEIQFSDKKGEPTSIPLKGETGPAVVNIGLNVNDGSTITVEQAIAEITKTGAKVTDSETRQSDSEPTLIATLDRALTPEEAHTVSENLKQESIAQKVGNTGELYGPGSEKWKPFNEKYFLSPDKERVRFSKKNPLIGMAKAELPVDAKSPLVKWDKDELRANAEMIKESWSGVKSWGKGQPTVYQSYVPIDEVPRARTPEIEGVYDWGEYKKSGVFPPITIVIHQNGVAKKLEDGNHRAKFWTEKGFTHFPAWIVDFRKVQVSKTRFSKRIWFSAMGNMLAEKTPANSSVQQVRNLLKGAKEDEIKWTGINEYLDAQKGPVNKHNMLKWLETNDVQIKEVTKTSDPKSTDNDVEIPFHLEQDIGTFNNRWNALQTDEDGLQFQTHRDFPGLRIVGPDASDEYMIRLPNGKMVEVAGTDEEEPVRYNSFNEASEDAYEIFVSEPLTYLQNPVDRFDQTQYEGYKLSGGEDYTELLLILPHANDGSKYKAAPNFQSSHFDEPNIVAHVRFDTRKAGTGESVLFLEEVQSDWHEQGRERGYVGDADDLARKAIVKEIKEKYPALNKQESDGWSLNSLTHAGVDQDLKDRWFKTLMQGRDNSPVPDAPFSKTWPELVMKRMLRHAAEHNYDRLAWTTGAQQNERYGLAKHVQEIYVREDKEEGQEGTYYIGGKDTLGIPIRQKGNLTPKDLADHIGKELAEKAISDLKKTTQDTVRYSGLDLEVGGSGMKYFYDQMLPRFMEKYLKRFGTKVDALHVETDVAASSVYKTPIQNLITVHSIALTPDMKESVINKGQPKFSRRNAAITYPVHRPGKLDSFIRLLQDKNIDIKRLVESIEKSGGTVPEQLNPVLAEEMFQKRDEQRAKDFTNDELRPLVDLMRLNKVSVKQLDEYLHARHVLDDNLNARLQAINPDLSQSPDWNKLSGLTDAEAQAIINGANGPAMQALVQHVDDIVETTRELMVHYGLEKQSTIDTWRQEYKRYVPLRREGFDGEGNETGMGKSVRGSTIKQRGGSGLAVENILANIAQARDQIVTRGEKNRVSVAMAGLQMLHPNPAIATLDKPATLTYIDPATGLTATVPGNLTNYEVPTIRRFNPKSGKMQTYPDPTYKGRDNVVSFRVKGEDYAIVFNENNDLALKVSEAMKNLGTPQLNGIMKAVAPYTRYLAAVNTQYNPIFGLVNFVRDSQFAMITLSSTPLAGKQAVVFKNAVSTLAGIYQDARDIRRGRQGTTLFGRDRSKLSSTAQLWQRFEHVGGPTGYRDLFFSASERVEEIERMMDPSSWKGTYNPQKFGKRMEETALFKWLSDYNLMMENSIRLGVFKAGIDAGMSDLLAASYAKNITVNFNKKGQIGAQMGSLYAFFNANVQGTARIAETLFERTPAGFKISSVGKKIITGGLLLGMMQTAALALGGFDDDDPPEFVKQKNMAIPAPGTEKGYVMIPMPLGFNLLPTVGRLVSETMVDIVKGKPAHPFEKGAALFTAIFGTMSPLGGTGGLQEVAPTVSDPIVAIMTNRDWTGKTIAKDDHSTLNPSPGHTRSHNTATAWAKALSYAINWATGGTDYVPGVLSPSPDTIDYLVEQATGGVGREFSKSTQVIQSAITGEELPMHKIPLVGRFVGTASGSSSIRNKFYENVKASNLAYREFEGRAIDRKEFSEYVRTHPEARFSKAAKQIQDDVAVLNKQKAILLKGGAGRELIQAQEKRITDLMGRFNSLIEKAQEQAP